MPTQADPPRSAAPDPGDDSSGGTQATAQEVAGRAQDKAQEAAAQVQDRTREQVDQRSTQVGEQIHQQASDLRSVSEALRDQGKDRPAQATDRLAGYAEQVGSYLRDKDADSLLSDAEEFGRQKPAAVAAGALAIGFVAARVLKASSNRRYASRERPPASAGSPGSPTPPPVSRQAPPTEPALQSPARAEI